MNPSNDHKPATAEKPERFLAWVCSDLTCPEWGPAGDKPRECVNGHPTLKVHPADRPTPKQ